MDSVKDAIARDRLIKEHDIQCFEMGAAGQALGVVRPLNCLSLDSSSIC